MKRKIISINEELCNGCSLCVNACHEGAIQMVDGKAKLISDQYCDGLGDCLPACPTGAIKIIERDADAYSQEAVDSHLANQKSAHEQVQSLDPLPCGCPGTMSQKIAKKAVITAAPQKAAETVVSGGSVPSELSQWPVQLKLVNPTANYFKDADLLVAADCVAFAYGNFHQEFIKGRTTVIGCPKLDDNEYYVDKLTQILAQNTIKSITVVRMEVPCCGGIITAVKKAMLNSGTIVPYREVTISIDGQLI